MSAAARGKTLPPFTVRYPKRMKPRRTYSVRVSWRGTPPKLGDDAPKIAVRLIMGGAQVVPAERPMDPNRPREKAIFSVTPLAKGWLKQERLEVIADGVKVQEIALPAKVVGQRKAWVCLILAFLVPWLLINFVHGDYHAVYIKKFTSPWRKYVEPNTPVTWLKSQSVNLTQRFTGKAELKKAKKAENGKKAPEGPNDETGTETGQHSPAARAVSDFWLSAGSIFDIGWQTIMDDKLYKDLVDEFRQAPKTPQWRLRKDNDKVRKNGGGGDVPPPIEPLPKIEKKEDPGGDPKGTEKKAKKNAPKTKENGKTKTQDNKKNSPKGKKNGGGQNPNAKVGGARPGMKQRRRPQVQVVANPPAIIHYRLYLAFYSSVIFFLLAVFFAFIGRQRYGKRSGRPLTLAIIED